MAILFLFCFLPSVLSAILAQFDTLVSFGDSYSSINGGLTDGGPQSYYNSRLAKALNVSNFICYANGGAIIDKRIVPGYKTAPQYQYYANSVAYQMNSFQNNVNDSKIAYNSNTLYVLWIGFNDLNFNRFTFISNWSDYTATIAYFIKSNIDIMDSIYKANPSYKHHQWLVLNLPTFYNFPSSTYQQISGYGGETLLNQNIKAMYPPKGNNFMTTNGYNLTVVDIYNVSIAVAGEPGYWALTPYGQKYLTSRGNCVTSVICPDPEHYMFYIFIHRGSTMHKLFADKALLALDSQFISTEFPTSCPSSAQPTKVPTSFPSRKPTRKPSRKPTSIPTAKPTQFPTE